MYEMNVRGYRVSMPVEPYDVQVECIDSILQALEGGEHALIESPTGCGKSLALLSSTLAWLRSRREERGRIETQEDEYGNIQDGSRQSALEQARALIGNGSAAARAGKGGKKSRAEPRPVIFYCTRTHSQIHHIVREFRRMEMHDICHTVLASREHTCVHPRVSKSKAKSDDCRQTTKDGACAFFSRATDLVARVQKAQPVWDIEDLVEAAPVVKGCPYYAARSELEKADIVFCPYNYVIDPLISSTMDIDLEGSVVIFDEAHNIEDISRSSASFTGSVDTFEAISADIANVTRAREEHPNAARKAFPCNAYEAISALCDQVSRHISRLGRNLDAGSPMQVFSGHMMLSTMESMGLSDKTLSVIEKHLESLAEEAERITERFLRLSSMAINTLEKLVLVAKFMYTRPAWQNPGQSGPPETSAADFRLAIERQVAFGSTGPPALVMHIWCLNPAVAFRAVAERARSVILTSGTLSPLDSFASELGCQFGVVRSTSHVVDVDEQIRHKSLAMPMQMGERSIVPVCCFIGREGYS